MSKSEFIFDQIFNVDLNNENLNKNLPNKRIEVNDFIYTQLNKKYTENFPPIPCVYDSERDMLSYALNIDPYLALKAPFHFIYLRDNVKEIGNISFSARYNHPSNYSDPYFIFSTGRCGSTLLSKILQCFDVISISEPDFYNQLIHQYVNLKIRTEISLLKFQQIYSMMTADLLMPFNYQRAFLKLSSNCNYFPSLVLSCCREKPKVIFLIRNFISWTNSRKKTFETNLQSDYSDYIKALETFLYLKENCNALLIKYEDICSNVESVKNELCNFFSIEIKDQELLDLVLTQDAQKDSKISMENIKKKNISDRNSNEMERFWEAHRPEELIKKLDLLDYI